MKNILIPVDFSGVLSDQLRAVIGLAEPNASLTLLHVTSGSGQRVLYSSRLEVDEVDTGLLAELVWCERVLRATSMSPVDIELHIETGNPSEVIVRLAEEHKCDGLVLGSHGHGALHNLLHGSTTERILNETHLPMCVVPSPGSSTFTPSGRCVVVAVDLGKQSSDLIQYGIAEAKRRGVPVHLLHTCAPTGPNTDALLDATNRLESLSKELASAADFDPQNIHVFVEPGTPADLIPRRVRRLQPTVLVIGSKPRSRLSSAVLGSQAREIVKAVGVPVLVLPAHDEASAGVTAPPIIP